MKTYPPFLDDKSFFKIMSIPPKYIFVQRKGDWCSRTFFRLNVRRQLKVPVISQGAKRIAKSF